MLPLIYSLVIGISGHYIHLHLEFFKCWPFIYFLVMYFYLTAGHCPQVLAAAQILYDMATRPLRQSPDGILRWPKKLSQKGMKARKLKSIEKPEEIYATSLTSGRDNRVRRCADQILPSKRLKLSKADNKRDFIYSDPVRKRSMTCCSPRSDRSSSSILVKDSVGTERRNSSSNTIKQSCMMPPPCKGSRQGLRESIEGMEADAHGVGKGKR